MARGALVATISSMQPKCKLCILILHLYNCMKGKKETKNHVVQKAAINKTIVNVTYYLKTQWSARKKDYFETQLKNSTVTIALKIILEQAIQHIVSKYYPRGSGGSNSPLQNLDVSPDFHKSVQSKTIIIELSETIE